MLCKWDKYTKRATEHNLRKASFYDELLLDLKNRANELELTVIYRRIGIDDSDSYLHISDIVNSMMEVYEEKTTWRKDWEEFEPKKSTNMRNGDLHSLNWYHSQVMVDADEEKIDQIIAKIKEIFDDETYVNKYLELKVDEDKVIKDRSVVRSSLDKVIKDIDLGHNIKGKCTLC